MERPKEREGQLRSVEYPIVYLKGANNVHNRAELTRQRAPGERHFVPVLAERFHAVVKSAKWPYDGRWLGQTKG